MLPKKTAICQQYKKCGKLGCKCNAGALHGPYFFYFYRSGGKLKKTYIRKADAAKLWENYQKLRLIQKQRGADKKKFTKLYGNLRLIDKLLSEISIMDAGEIWK